jgi:hypothetical protein
MEATCFSETSIDFRRIARHCIPRGRTLHWICRLNVCNVVTRMSDFRRGFGLVIGFIDYFITRLVTTLNYSAIADSTL